MLAALLISTLMVGSGCAELPEPVDQDAATGFAIYRSGRLDARGLAALCALGVEEIVVMDGSALEQECALRDAICPALRVRYNHRQDPRRPVSGAFLEAFADWAEDSRQTGRGIAIRCRHGWHRTGRLAAFYRIRFQGWTGRQAASEMAEKARMMWQYPELTTQVEAMEQWLLGENCPAAAEYCPATEPGPGEALVIGPDGARFFADACASGPRPGSSP